MKKKDFSFWPIVLPILLMFYLEGKFPPAYDGVSAVIRYLEIVSISMFAMLVLVMINKRSSKEKE